jgi:uncharacterized protein (TIGR00297 family)
MARWGAGVALALLVAVMARRAGALSASGAAAAALLGTVAVGAGWDWAVLLVAYFMASSALSRLGAGRRAERTAGRIERDGPRDAIQVVANGGVFGVAALAWIATGGTGGGAGLWHLAGVAALAASAADTWATEIGTLSRSQARSILTGRAVPHGTSGGITALGLMAAFAGAAFVAATATAVGWSRDAANAAIVGGVAGAILDSLLGASLQARRFCHSCGVDTEVRVHRCGTRTVRHAGITWLDNDAVNAVSTVAGALVGAVLVSVA